MMKNPAGTIEAGVIHHLGCGISTGTGGEVPMQGRAMLHKE
jgi:hypothetical protein